MSDRGRGRPSTGTRIEVRVPADVLAKLDDWASEEGWTRPDLIRWILEQQFADGN